MDSGEAGSCNLHWHTKSEEIADGIRPQQRADQTVGADALGSVRNEDAAPMLHRDEPFRLENAEGVADHGAADLEILAESTFGGQAGTGVHLPIPYRCQDLTDRLFTKGLPS